MKFHPVRVPRHPYRGRDPRKVAKAAEYNRVAVKVEALLSTELEGQPDDTIHVFPSADIALQLCEDSDLVHEIIFSIDCGHNGVTVCKGNSDRAFETAGANID